MSRSVLYEVSERVCTITMNAPERRNAFDLDMLHGLSDAFDRAAADTDVNVIVFTGAGDAFCAGGDVKDMGSELDPNVRKEVFTTAIHLVPKAMRRVDKPIIAMLNGPAVGAGFDMALWADVRVASESAKLSEGYVNVGLAAGDGGAYLLPRLIGIGRALEILMTGRPLTGAEAADLGVVNRAVPREELERETYALAGELASKPPNALRMMKRLVYQSVEASFDTALELASSQVAILMCGDEHRSAVEAFRNRR